MSKIEEKLNKLLLEMQHTSSPYDAFDAGEMSGVLQAIQIVRDHTEDGEQVQEQADGGIQI